MSEVGGCAECSGYGCYRCDLAKLSIELAEARRLAVESELRNVRYRAELVQARQEGYREGVAAVIEQLHQLGVGTEQQSLKLWRAGIRGYHCAQLAS